jgi:hypothetical protein
MIKTYPSLIKKKTYTTKLDNKRHMDCIKWHHIYLNNGDLWHTNNLFAINNDPLAKKYIDKHWSLLNGDGAYTMIHMDNYPYQNDEHDNIGRGNIIIQKNGRQNGNSPQAIDARNKKSRRHKLITTLDDLVIVNENSEFIEAIPQHLNEYIMRTIKPNHAILKNDLCYLNKNEEIIAYVNPMKIYKHKTRKTNC